jgi:hypothetical protein
MAYREVVEKLRFTDSGEVARFMIAAHENKHLNMEWVHTMRAPVMEHGIPVMVDKKRKDGTVYGQDYSTRFVGKRLCLGDPDVLEDKGMDPSNCPACAAAKRGVRDMRPERRYTTAIIRYATRSKKEDTLRVPPSADILVWELTQKQFGLLSAWKRQVRDLLEIPEGQEFGLNVADVVLVCEDSDWQRVRWDAAKRPAWKSNAAVRQLVQDLWREEANRPTQEQLRLACGKDNGRDYMEEDVEEAESAWAAAERAGATGTADPTGGDPLSGGTEDLDAGLDSLLSDGPAASAAAGVEDPFADTSGGLGEFVPKEETSAAAAPAEAADPLADAPTAEPAAPADSKPASAPSPAAAPPSEPADDLFGGDGTPAAAPAGKAASNGTADDEGASFDDVLAGL